MNKLLIILSLFLGITSGIYSQAITVNGIPLFESGGAPMTCSPGGYKTISSASTSGTCLQMTTSGFQAGAVWVCDGINLNETFKINFSANIGTDISTGDGVAFLLQQEALPGVLGGRGGGLGYATGDGVGCQSGPCPIDPSIAVEFDTYNGAGWGDNDLVCHHMSMQLDGSTSALATIEGPACLLPSGAGVVDGLNHDICITWDPALLEYKAYFDGLLVGTFNGDIRFFFPDPTDVWWGFTSASGGAPQNQSVCDVVMETNVSNPSCVCNPIVLTASASSDPTTCAGLDGEILITGLLANTSYNLAYDINGTTMGPFSITSDASGNYQITNVGAGTYTNFTADLAGCASSDVGPVLLSEPNPPVLIVTDPNPRCEPSTIDITDPGITMGSTGGGVLTYWQDALATIPLLNPGTVSASGTYYIQSDNGCTDIAAVNVTISPAPVINAPLPFGMVICNGSSPSFTPSADIAGSTFSWTASASSGNLSGFSVFGNGTINDVIINSGNTSETVTYTITPTGPSPGFCDGLPADFIVTVEPNLFGTDIQAACNSYTWIDGNTYNASNNTATWTITNATGCDSLVTLDLTITNSTTGTDTQSACATYTWIDGNTYNVSKNTATLNIKGGA